MPVSIRMNTASKATKLWLVPLCLLALCACSSGITVRSDSSPTADFSQYKTYGFFKTLGIEGGYNSPIYGELFRAAISQDMEARGYTLADDPDLLINVTSRYDEKARITTYTMPYVSGAYYDMIGGPYYGSAVGVGAAVGTTTRVEQEASAFIDLVDNATDSLVWQGVSVIEFSDKKAQHLKQTIDEAVNRVFALYPHTAGH